MASAEIILNGGTPTRLKNSDHKPPIGSPDPVGDLPLTSSTSLVPLKKAAHTQNEECKGRKVLRNDDFAAASDDHSGDIDEISSEKTHALEADDKDLMSGVSRDSFSPRPQSIRSLGQGVYPTAFSTESSVTTSSLMPGDASRSGDMDLAPVSLDSSIARTKSFLFENTVPSDKEMDAFGFQSQLDSDDYFSTDSELSRSGDDDGLSSKTRQSLALYAENSWHQERTGDSSPSRHSKLNIAESKSSLNSKRGGEILFTKDKPGSFLMQHHSNLTNLLNEDFGIENNLSNAVHDDKALRCLIAVPRLSIGFENPIQIKVDESFAVEDVIQTSLTQIRRLSQNKGGIFAVDLNSQLWNLYLADDDGQIDDDMGPLERNRLLVSYCADEFVLDYKSNDDCSQNNFKCPKVASSSVLQESTNAGPRSIETLGSERLASLNSFLHATSDGSGITFDDKKNKSHVFIDSDTRRLASGKHSQQGREVESVMTKASNNASMGNDVGSSNETMQANSFHHVSKRKKKFQTLLQLTGLNGNEPHISGTNHGDSQTTKDRGYLGSGTYYRWTIWRRQQMSFRGRYPKSLVIDGHQIYILPFNESKGSWYESKTTSFDFNQIIKVKQNPRIPHYFKIVVMKQNHEAPKTYHLEAANAAESRAIVKTFNLLMERFPPTNEKT
ncbi:hypothetical protein KL918_005397 [Ogataea parapolymorpha]|uniref:Target of rapamycin complex 2 subunit AVO1 n=1 Tax=Ogataea parapolymorpha (strain ATCC 26012 / BCRC 20466 / JCM 22074 / NRRL Y-7560 / DL-1) TaxID=871575 RepID=W1QBH1_OGAPD|nr:Target of rapamycin complex 2 subunit AVO1 [Ogataea parapolymorpha DL-1]ESW98391.1 Target of rapamycin complex 2 subunit AVO1 [Ogataea parapolymorpha DL-1]KAG7864608.1 hypothetical protein KL918_005397 [Ogataea parapolymorpha]KAG7867118.1 hypothetical protein KL916_005420 [Ogataea parapolymorpha]